MSNEEKEVEIRKVLNPKHFKLLSVQNVNHDPHPFTIGPAHVKHASNYHSGRLGEETLKNVPCAFRGCNVAYENHKSDTVAFLQLVKTLTKDEANKTIKKVVDNIPKDLIDGFTMVDTPEKFRIE